jgi:hypothetical protein
VRVCCGRAGPSNSGKTSSPAHHSRRSRRSQARNQFSTGRTSTRLASILRTVSLRYERIMDAFSEAIGDREITEAILREKPSAAHACDLPGWPQCRPRPSYAAIASPSRCNRTRNRFFGSRFIPRRRRRCSDPHGAFKQTIGSPEQDQSGALAPLCVRPCGDSPVGRRGRRTDCRFFGGLVPSETRGPLNRLARARSCTSLSSPPTHICKR